MVAHSKRIDDHFVDLRLFRGPVRLMR